MDDTEEDSFDDAEEQAFAESIPFSLWIKIVWYHMTHKILIWLEICISYLNLTRNIMITNYMGTIIYIYINYQKRFLNQYRKMCQKVLHIYMMWVLHVYGNVFIYIYMKFIFFIFSSAFNESARKDRNLLMLVEY